MIFYLTWFHFSNDDLGRVCTADNLFYPFYDKPGGEKKDYTRQTMNFRKRVALVVLEIVLLLIILILWLDSNFRMSCQSEPVSVDTKYILFWNRHWEYNELYVKSEETDILIKRSDGSLANCRFGKNHDLLNVSHAIVFNAFAPVESTPIYRRHDQIWVYYSWESPAMLQRHQSDQQWLNVEFNLTMSYSPLADVYTPIGTFRSHPTPSSKKSEINQKINSFTRTFSSRPYDAIWIVSDCK